MSKSTEKVKQAESDYKKIFKIRLVERRKEQDKKNIRNGALQDIGIKKALLRKIALRRSI